MSIIFQVAQTLSGKGAAPGNFVVIPFLPGTKNKKSRTYGHTYTARICFSRIAEKYFYTAANWRFRCAAFNFIIQVIKIAHPGSFLFNTCP